MTDEKTTRWPEPTACCPYADCDTCHEGGPVADSFASALGAVVLAGWTHRTDGTDECPECIAQPKED